MEFTVDDNLFNEEELANTKGRYERFMKEWEETRAGFKFTTFDNPGYDQMVMLKDIEFASMCAHHLLPFHGKAHIGYIPGDRICGISKLARVLDMFASKPQTQEKLTGEIVSFINKELKPQGIMVVIEAAHDCMRIRGVKKQNSMMVTSQVDGIFKEDAKAREEFLVLMK